MATENLTLTAPVNVEIRGSEIINEHPDNPPVNNTMSAVEEPGAGVTSESPEFIRSLGRSPVVSDEGRAALELVAAALAGGGTGLLSYSLTPNPMLARGKMFCDQSASFCHFQATKNIPYQTPSGERKSFPVDGGDVMRVVNGRMIRVGYALDKRCKPQACVSVCEARGDDQ